MCIYTLMTAAHPRLPELDALRSQRHVCLAEELRAANRAIAKCYAEHLHGVDVNVSQFSLLIRLYFLGDVAITKLARHLETDRTTVARNVQLLERSGHLEIVTGADRRARLVRLSETGRASLEATLPLWRAAQEELSQLFGGARWAEIFKTLRSLAEVDKIRAPAPANQHSGASARQPIMRKMPR